MCFSSPFLTALQVIRWFAGNTDPTGRRICCNVPAFLVPVVNMDRRYNLIHGICAERRFTGSSWSLIVLDVTCFVARNFSPTQRGTFCEVPAFPGHVVNMDWRYTGIPGMCTESGFADLSHFLMVLHVTCLLASKLLPTGRDHTFDAPALCVASAPCLPLPSYCPPTTSVNAGRRSESGESQYKDFHDLDNEDLAEEEEEKSSENEEEEEDSSDEEADSEENATCLRVHLNAKERRTIRAQESLLLDSVRRQKCDRWTQVCSGFWASDAVSESAADYARLNVTGDERAPGVVDTARLARFQGQQKQCLRISVTIQPAQAPIYCLPVGVERRFLISYDPSAMINDTSLVEPLGMASACT